VKKMTQKIVHKKYSWLTGGNNAQIAGAYLPEAETCLLSSRKCNPSVYQAAWLLAFSAVLLMGMSSTAGAVTVTAGPGTCASVAGVGSVAWSNPGNAMVQGDGNYASATINNSNGTNYLQCTGYGFAIPAGASINGITVNVWRRAAASNCCSDAYMRLVKAGTIQATNRSTATIYPTGNTSEAHGNAADLWGGAWTAADINNANFGAAFAVQNSSGTDRLVRVDFIQIVVDYTPTLAVSSINYATSNPTVGSTAVPWTVVFNQSVTGVDATDFALVQAGGVSGAGITSVTGSGTTYTVTASTGSGTGTLGLNLVDDDSIINATSVPLGGVGVGNGNFTGQVYTVTACTPPSNIPVGVTVTCVCDNFGRASLNPSTIFGSNWIVSSSDGLGINPYINATSNLLRMTENTGSNAKAATVPGIFPAAGNYISVEFKHYAYWGSGADGVAVTLSDYAIPATPGAFGGSLGYAQRTIAGGGGSDVSGFAGGWLGVGIDEYGNYQNPTEGRIGGPGAIVESVGMRGSGSALLGYNWLGGTAALNPIVDNRGSTTASPGYYYQVIIDARNATAVSTAVNRDTTGTGNTYTSLISVPNVFTANPTQLAVPANWQISFTGSTGGSTNIHEIGGLRVCAQTVVPLTGGTASGFSAIDEAYPAAPTVPSYQSFQTGHIYMKLPATSFKLWVAALTSTAISTGYSSVSAKYVQVKLVDNSGQVCGSDALRTPNTCNVPACAGAVAVEAGASQIGTFASGSATGVASPLPSFTLNSSWQNLIAVMRECTTSSCTAFTATAPACSADSFSVRPTSIASVTSSNATNLSTSGTPVFKAGSDTFALTATTTGVAGFNSGYTGTPKINSASVQAVSPATQAGTVGGNFNPATTGIPSSTGTGSNTSFTYSEVGAFKILGPDFTVPRIPGVYDDIWTAIDSDPTKNDCITGTSATAYSNTKDANGKYGCYFGITANTAAFGRFIPDHFDTAMVWASGVPMACPTGLTCPISYNGFVYSGQSFTTQVIARNLGGGTTLNYDSARGYSKAVALTPWNPAGGMTAPSGGGTLTQNTVPSAAFSLGAATTSTPAYAFTTPPIAPTDVYIRADESPGGDSVTSLRGVSSVEGGIKVVSGRLKISSAHGSELLPLPIGVTIQYWNNTNYFTSTTDSTTVIANASINAGLYNWQKKPATSTFAAGSTSVVAPPASVAFANGVGSFKLAAPGAGATGSVDIKNNIGPSYLPNNIPRATFGVYKGANEFIYLRENY
jgi:MSHA biogenesis protein MshQ